MQNHAFKETLSFSSEKNNSLDLCPFFKMAPVSSLPARCPLSPFSCYKLRTDSHHKNVPHHLEKYSLVGASDSEFQKIFFRCLSFNETQDIYCQVVPMLIFELSLCYHLFAQNTALCYSAFLFAYISVEHS